MPRRLKTELVAWLLLPLLAVAAFNVWSTHRAAFATAGLFTDRMLLASARVIAEQVKDNDGSIEALIPPSAIEMFASPDRDRVLYRVLAPSGELIAGYPDLPRPEAEPSEAEPVFFDARFRIEDIRAVAITQRVVSPRAGGHALIIVAGTLKGRDRLVRTLWFAALRDQLTLVGLAALLALFGLHRGLSRLDRLRTELGERQATALTPISTAGVPLEITPLVEALNVAFARVRNHIDLQRRFIANASHQLRTPLALLKTQLAVGAREDDLAGKNEALGAIGRGVDGLVRVVDQLLTLARAETGGAALRKAPIDLAAAVRAALERLSDAAFDRRLDLTFDCALEAAPVSGHEALIQAVVTNLVENALNAAPPGGAIHVRLALTGQHFRLQVEDTGPGIAEADRDRVFERFYRGAGATYAGSGLGLAIVREIVAAHDGTIALSRAEAGGLCVAIGFPAALAPA